MIIHIKHVKSALTKGSWLWKSPVCGGPWAGAHFVLP